MKKDTKNWVQIAKYDLETAKAMMSSSRFLYVLFTCQQAVEKMLKALIVEFADIFPPRSHDLIKLLELTMVKTDAATQNFLAKLSYYYIEARYPEEVARIYREVNKSLAREYLNKTKEIMNWLEKKLS